MLKRLQEVLLIWLIQDSFFMFAKKECKSSLRGLIECLDCLEL
jgi:hypothetical protein